ncbi:MAG TPA: hypothetical protein DCG51_09990 [Erysipelotrichaceae bacterium]|nr:hypothetical protein [Erysipelotrichaceae bacterium]
MKKYEPKSSSISSGQVLAEPYSFEKAEIIVKEMTDSLVLDLTEKHLLAISFMLAIGYDTENLNEDISGLTITDDWYGRKVPKGAHGSVTFDLPNVSSSRIRSAAVQLYHKIADPACTVRRITVCAQVIDEDAPHPVRVQQFDLFSAPEEQAEETKELEEELAREKRAQEAMITLQKKYGKNIILKGTNLTKGATMKQRNNQIGGHRK